MKRMRRTHISLETKQVLVIRSARRIARIWCAECGETTPVLTPEEAASVSGVATGTIYRWAEEGQVHFTSPPEGALLICLSSLLRLKSL